MPSAGVRSQHTATHCNTLQHTATHCNKLEHTGTHCITLHHTAIYIVLSFGIYYNFFQNKLWFLFRYVPSCEFSLYIPKEISVWFLLKQVVISQYMLRLIITYSDCPTHNIEVLGATHCNKLQHPATNCNTLTAARQRQVEHTAPAATRCNTLQHVTTHCNTLQHADISCNTPSL